MHVIAFLVQHEKITAVCWRRRCLSVSQCVSECLRASLPQACMYFHVHVWLHGHCSCFCMLGRGWAGCSAFAWAGPDLDFRAGCICVSEAGSRAGSLSVRWSDSRARLCGSLFIPTATAAAASTSGSDSWTAQLSAQTRVLIKKIKTTHFRFEFDFRFSSGESVTVGEYLFSSLGLFFCYCVSRFASFANQ